MKYLSENSTSVYFSSSNLRVISIIIIIINYQHHYYCHHHHHHYYYHHLHVVSIVRLMHCYKCVPNVSSIHVG